jgi:hypothetical protein
MQAFYLETKLLPQKYSETTEQRLQFYGISVQEKQTDNIDTYINGPPY